MSGHKRATITISEEEYRRLHDAEMKLRFVPTRPVEAAWVCSDQVERLEDRRRQFEQTVRGFTREVQAAELETARALAQRQAELYQDLSAVENRVNAQARALLDEQAQHFSALLEEEHRRRQADVFLLQNQLDDVLAGQERKFHSAQQWLEQAQAMAAFIDQHYNHPAFTPGELPRLDRVIEQAVANLSAGMPEAALLGAQQAYAGLSELRLRLEGMESEWQLLLGVCWEYANHLLIFAQENQACLAHDLDGNELPYPIEVDFWTGGELSRQAAGLQQLLDELQLGVFYDIPALRALEREELPAHYQQLSETLYQARLAVLNSQLRINIADLVVQALQEQGFHLVESDYANGDQRMAFSARVRNLAGNEIVVQVTPDPHLLGKNELHLISLDRAQHTEHELRRRSQEVARSLGRRGLEVGEVRATGDERERRAPLGPAQRPARRRSYHRIPG